MDYSCYNCNIYEKCVVGFPIGPGVIFMIDNTRVRMMTKLAVYEEGNGKKDLKMQRYSRGAFLSLRLLGSFFAVTVACILGGILYIMRYYSNIVTEGLAFSYEKILLKMLVVYLIVMIVNLVLTFWIQSRRYDEMEKNIRQYDRRLFELKKYLEKEESLQ